ncbi:hypothetical protein [Pseudomonas syringae group genomosp. 3]|uniref:Uncharacterized protein n=1 Tax=Pseudomonas syringae pv. tomato (strain ATCC BAA-871 / DC3000) TaxID=223283 RepID=Q87XX2_PSESM|nr:hypothetical protein [Pseudomonas syringae group genomosp. 3]AAO57509.1 hypothetical protein PSPTO_4052 [Pseudomonas syringae pv. tomato str. DC3000]KKI24515.1 hypothetical protein WX98_19410 [Pseudomonas syringae pv. persicae]
MSSEFKMVPVRREVLEQAAHWLHVHHNGPSAETNAADDLLEAVRMANAEKDNPCLNCSGTGEIQSSGYSSACSECSGSGKSEAPQPPALGGVPAGLDLQRIVTEALMGMIAAVTSTSPPANEPPPPFIQAGIDRAVSRISAHLVPLQAEIEHLRAGGALIVQHMNDYKKERDQLKAEAETLSETTMAQESMIEQLKEESFEGLYNAALDERDQLQARCDELEKAFRKLRDVAHGCQQIASSYSPCIDSVEEHGGDDHEDPSCAIHHRLYYAMFDADAALSKPAGSEQV